MWSSLSSRSIAWAALIGLLLWLAGCASDASQGAPEPAQPVISAVDLPDLGPAPEILNETWLNAVEPYTLASQRGKVVLLKFWTFG